MLKNCPTILLVIAMILLSQGPAGATCDYYGRTLRWQGGAANFLNLVEVVIAGSEAVVVRDATTNAALLRYDINDPAHPLLAGNCALPGNPSDVAVSGNYAYVAAGGAGLQVVDLDWNAIVGETVGVNEQAVAVAVSGSLVVIVDGGSNLYVVDVSVPTAPTIVGHVVLAGEAQDVVIDTSSAYVACGSEGLQVVDLSVPASPQVISVFDTPGTARRITVDHGLACLADGSGGLQLFDVSDPVEPRPRGTLAVAGGAVAVTLDQGRLFVVTGNIELLAVDASDPFSPSVIGSTALPNVALELAVSGDFVYVADTNALQVYLAASVINSPPSAVMVTELPEAASALCWADAYVYAATGAQGLQILDATDPLHATVVSVIAAQDQVHDVAVADQHAFVADGAAGLRIFEVATPASPQTAGSVDTPDIAMGVCLSGDLAYVADSGSGLQVIDIADTAHPAIVGALDTPGIVRCVAVSADGAYAFIGDNNYVRVIDVTNPALPIYRVRVNVTGTATEIVVNGSYLYVAAGTAGVKVIDVTSPLSPVVITTVAPIPWTSVEHISIGGPTLYVSDSVYVQVLDLADPGHPALSGVAVCLDAPQAIAVSGTDVFVASSLGIEVVPIPCTWVTAAPRPEPFGAPTLDVFPSPAADRASVRFELGAASRVRADVFDIAGRRVRALGDESRSEGPQVFTWDGRDDRGRSVAAGAYLFRVVTDAGASQGRFVMLR